MILKDSKAIYEFCVSELKAFVHTAGFSDVVIGLSGGIDSSLVATMAKDAFGSDHVHGILLPGPYSSDHSINDAIDLANNLEISYVTIPISEAYDAFSQTFNDAYNLPLVGLASENTQARCRMIFIMAASNAFGWMMLNTGNKSEAAMGYSTLYGDTAGAFSPIGGLYKTQVYELANWRNSFAQSQGEIPPIPKNAIEKPPSAELSPDQKDETSLGISYDELDQILRGLYDQNLSVENLVQNGFSKEQIDNVIKRFEASSFKRKYEPPFPKI